VKLLYVKLKFIKFMRKLSLFIALGLFVAGTFTSCTKDDTKPAPTITFNVGGVAKTEATATVGTALLFEVRVQAPAKIKQITFYQGADESNKQQIGTAKTSGFTNDTLDISNQTVTATAAGTLKFFVTVVDENDQESSAALTITVSEPVVGGAISTYTAVLLGSNQNTSTGSYLSTTTGEVFFSSAKQAKSAVIDIIYGSENSTDEFFSPALALSGITGGNATKYATSTINFDNVTDDLLLQGITATLDKVSGIVVGNVYQFVTAAGKKGIFKVTAYTAGISGSVTINVKVQK
jgi:hypothetical protein